MEVTTREEILNDRDGNYCYLFDKNDNVVATVSFSENLVTLSIPKTETDIEIDLEDTLDVESAVEYILEIFSENGFELETEELYRIIEKMDNLISS